MFQENNGKGLQRTGSIMDDIYLAMDPHGKTRQETSEEATSRFDNLQNARWGYGVLQMFLLKSVERVYKNMNLVMWNPCEWGCCFTFLGTLFLNILYLENVRISLICI